jgi:hypothetical protein
MLTCRDRSHAEIKQEGKDYRDDHYHYSENEGIYGELHRILGFQYNDSMQGDEEYIARGLS